MNYSVADAIAATGGDGDLRGTSSEISDLLPFGIAPGAKVVMRREKAAAEHVRTLQSTSYKFAVKHYHYEYRTVLLL